MKLLGFLATLFASLAFSNAYAVYSEADGTDGDLPIIKSVKGGGSKAYILTPSLWGDGAAPHPEADYVVMSNHCQYVSGEDRLFDANSLQIGTTDYNLTKNYSVGSLFFYNRGLDNPFTVPRDGLILVNGNIHLRYYYDTVINGKVKVLSNAAHPFELYDWETDAGKLQDAGYFRFTGPVSGPDTAVLLVTGKAARDNVKSFGLKAAGDWTDYLGTIVVTAEVNTVGVFQPLGSLMPAELVVTNTTIGGSAVLHDGTTLSSLVEGEPFGIGSLDLRRGSTLKLSADVTVKSLAVESGAKIRVVPTLETGAVPKIVVQEAATVTGGPIEIIVRHVAETELDDSVLVLPANTTLTEADFRLVDEDFDGAVYNVGKFVLEDCAAGKALKLKYAPTAWLLEADGSKRTVMDDSAWTNATKWSNAADWPDSATMPGGFHYIVKVPSGDKSLCLRTPHGGTISAPTGDVTFPGESLTIGRRSSFLVAGPSFTCSHLILENAASYYPSLYCDSMHFGRMTIGTGGAAINKYNIGTATFACEIDGSGDLKVTSSGGGSTSSSYGYVAFSGLNTNYLGSITATTTINNPADPEKNANKISPRFDRNYMHLKVSDKRNLGGTLPEPNPKALVLENMARLELDEGCVSLVLDEPTRGIFIKWVGRFLAKEGETMTVASPLAVDGTLWKEGDGTLVLANPAPTFGADATATEPVGDPTNHMFCVTGGGDVCLAAVDAVNGFDLFATNFTGRLVFDLSAATEGDFAAYGVRNVKTGAPFASFDDGQVVCVVELPDNVKDGDTFPILTVTDEAASDLADKNLLAFVRSDTLKGLHFAMTVAPRDNGDGTTTLMATVKRNGLMLLVR